MNYIFSNMIASPLLLFFELVLLSAAIFWGLVWLKGQSWGKSTAKFFASLNLAVGIIVAIGVLSAIGTFVEAKYNTETAQRAVYNTVWMWGILVVLCVNLIGVMADRWPWKKPHTAFILAHIGIILTMIGAVLTALHGVDGSMRFAIGQTASHVILTPKDLTVWSSFDGQSYVKLYDKQADFHKTSPSQQPVTIAAGEEKILIDEYIPFAAGSSKINDDESGTGGPAIRFQLDNTHVSVNQWLQVTSEATPEVHDMGPARVVLGLQQMQPTGKNEIFLYPNKEDKTQLIYEIYSAKKDREPVKGIASQGDVIQTGWMGLNFRIIRYIPSSTLKWDFKSLDYPNQMTTEAVRIKFRGQEHWLQLNSVVKLFTDRAVYLVSYGNRRLDLKIPIRLDKFNVGRYQGTVRAASYESEVFVEGIGKYTIGMNEPLKHKGFTFYQASFEEDEQGQPSHSILSVNFDPGRELKYLGCLLIVLGSAMLFWMKKFGRKKVKVVGKSNSTSVAPKKVQTQIQAT